MRISRIAIFALFSLGVGCGQTAFQKGASSFAKVSAATAQSFGSAFGDMAFICRRRWQVQFLHYRVQVPAGDRWRTSPRWSEWAHTHRDGGETMEEHCRRVSLADGAHLHSLAVIEKYAQALANLANAGAYDGSDVSDMLSSTADVAAAAQASVSGPVHAFASALGEPLKAMTDLVMRRWSTRQLRAAVASAATPIDRVLEALKLYVVAVSSELMLLTSDETELFETLQKKMPDGPSPGDAIAFYELATELDAERTSFDANVRAYAAALDALRSAHRELEAADVDGKREQVLDALKKMSGYVANAWTQLGNARHGQPRSAR